LCSSNKGYVFFVCVVFGCALFYCQKIKRKDVVNLKVIMCERCGANEMHEEGNYFVCDYCGSKFLKETKAERIFSVEGSLSNVNSLHRDLGNLTGGISLESDIERLLQKCRTDPKNKRKYINLILDIDPDNTDIYKV